jgi:hypothetical protein
MIFSATFSFIVNMQVEKFITIFSMPTTLSCQIIHCCYIACKATLYDKARTEACPSKITIVIPILFHITTHFDQKED